MKDMTEVERGQIEPTLRDADDSDAQLRAALDKDRQRAQHVRRNARATYRAMEGWQRVRSAEDWLQVCADSQEQYESGRFFLERLGAERHLDPKLMATLGSLRQTPDFALPVECSPFGLLTRGRKMRERPHGRASAEGRRQAGIQHGLQASNGAACGDGPEDGGRAQSRARHAPSVIRSWKRLAEAGRRRRCRPMRTSFRPTTYARPTPKSGNSSAPSVARPWRSKSCALPRRS